MKMRCFTLAISASLLFASFNARAACGANVSLQTLTPCSGGVTFLLTGAAQATGIDWVNSGDTILSQDFDTIYLFPYPLAAGNYRAVVSFGGCTDTTNYVRLYAPVTPVISISSGHSDTLCGGNNTVTFTAAVTGSLSNPVYQWFVNGRVTGANGNTYTGTFNNEDLVWCTYYSSSNPCSAVKPAVSNQVRLTVDDQSIYTISPNPDCNIDTLTVHGAASASSIVWAYNNQTVATAAAQDFYQILRAGPLEIFQGWQFRPEDIIVDSTGGIYVSDGYFNRVLYFAPGSNGTTIGRVVAGGNGAGSAANQLDGPGSICLDSHGNLYVLDQLNGGRIQKFPAGSDSTTNGVTVAGGNNYIGSGPNQFLTIRSIRTDKNDNLYVLDGQNTRVLEFAAGTALGDYPVATITTANAPVDMWVTPAGEIYISNQENEVLYYSLSSLQSGGHSSTIVAGGNGQGLAYNQLNLPQGVFVDAAGNLYVNDNGNDRVMEFPAGSTSATSGIKLTAYTFDPIQYTSEGLYVDGKGDVYIANAYYNVVDEFVKGSIIDSTYVPTLAGQYQATVVSTGGCRTQTLSVHADDLNIYGPSVIDYRGDTLRAYITVNVPLQWSFNGQVLSNSADTFLVASAPGDYVAIGIDSFGCTTMPDTFYFNPAGISPVNAGYSLNLSPNPTTGQVYITTGATNPQTITVYDANGRLIYTAPFKPEIDVTPLSAGVYFVEVQSQEGVARERFVKM